MEHGLTGVWADVGNQSPSRCRDALGFRQMGRRLHEVGQRLSMTVRDVADGYHMLFGDQKNMGRCLRLRIPESDDPIRLMKDLRGQLARGDPAEDAAGVGHRLESLPLELWAAQLAENSLMVGGRFPAKLRELLQ